jgi:hypothetical protein
MPPATARLVYGAALVVLGVLVGSVGLQLLRPSGRSEELPSTPDSPNAEGRLTLEVWSEFRGREDDFASKEEFYAEYFRELNIELAALRRSTASPEHGPAAGVWSERVTNEIEVSGDPRTSSLESLSALPYLGGYTGIPPESGLAFHSPEKAYAGYNFFVSGHGPEAFLMDMEGKILHRWVSSQEQAFPDLAHHYNRSTGFFRSAQLFENGDVVAVFDYLGAIRMNADSEILWSRELAHHVADVDEAGRVYLLTSEYRFVPEWNPHGLFIEDYVEVLAPDGTLQKRISVREAVEKSSYANVLSLAAALQTGSEGRAGDDPPRLYDLLHTNSVEAFDGTLRWMSPLFAKGNLLVSMRSSSTIAIIDPQTERVEWALTGPWMFQHASTLLPNGRILLFDNDFRRRKRSRVLEFDPFSQQIYWQFAGGPDKPFYSRICGAAQRLPNGNTLIADSESGRAFELTADYDLAWAWTSPYTAGERGEFIALLPQMQRLSPDFPVDNFLEPTR